MKRVIFLLFIGIVAGLGLLVLYKKNLNPINSVSEARITVALSEAAPELSSLITIAQAKGYFEEQGIELIIKNIANGVLAQREVASGIADIATTSNFGLVSDSFDNRDFRIISSIARSKVIEIIARSDRGIKNPADLKGKKIGVALKTAPEYFLGRFLTLHKMALSDVVIVDTPFRDMEEAIVTGKVDALILNDPFAYQIRTTLGNNAVIWPAQEGQDNFWILVSSKAYAENHSEELRRFLAAIIKAELLVDTDEEEARDIIQTALNVDKTYFHQTWVKSNFEVALEQALLISMEDQARWRIENKLTDKKAVPDYLNYIYFDAMEFNNPGKVTIIH